MSIKPIPKVKKNNNKKKSILVLTLSYLEWHMAVWEQWPLQLQDAARLISWHQLHGGLQGLVGGAASGTQSLRQGV